MKLEKLSFNPKYDNLTNVKNSIVLQALSYAKIYELLHKQLWRKTPSRVWTYNIPQIPTFNGRPVTFIRGWNIKSYATAPYSYSGGDHKVLAGSILYDNPRVVELVENFYKREFWDKAKLDLVNSQHIANEIFIFGVVAGMPPSIKKAQELVGVTVDGWVGKQTIAALNAFDEKVFDIKFDEEEIEHFEEIAANNPSKAWALKGWINRARAV